jgi:hypothetical protein
MRPVRLSWILCVSLVSGFGCAGKNPGKPEHRHAAAEQERIDNLCGAEPADWKTPFADEAAVQTKLRAGTAPIAGRELLLSLGSDARSCDAKMYRVCRVCMELEDNSNCSQIQSGAMEYCLEKEAGVSDPSAEEAPVEAPAE